MVQDNKSCVLVSHYLIFSDVCSSSFGSVFCPCLASKTLICTCSSMQTSLSLWMLWHSSVFLRYKKSTQTVHRSRDWLIKFCSSRKSTYCTSPTKGISSKTLPPWVCQLSFMHFWSYRIPYPQEIPIPSMGGVWIFSGTAH